MDDQPREIADCGNEKLKFNRTGATECLYFS